MNLVESIRVQREKLDAAVLAAEQQRDEFIQSISETLGRTEHSGKRGRRKMSETQRRKLSQAKKKYWNNRKAAKK